MVCSMMTMLRMNTNCLSIIFALWVCCSHEIVHAQAWFPDLGDGTYKNPIIHADYSDPDVVKIGHDFYMTSSSFNCVPALPILHSKDLVNWELINHAIPRFEHSDFNRPQHGNGVWAPAIRYHDGEFYIYYGDPDRGIFMVKTEDPRGPWHAPVLVKKAFGNIDPCPLWDDDGKVYMVHAFAHSRAGINSVLQVNELSPDGTQIVDKGVLVFDGHKNHPTIEGPKFYKRNGYYYIFAPAGGVKAGWQTVLRSKQVYGPYEVRTVLAQGNTDINGPHQGAYIELDHGEGWFIHFQDRDAYGRIVHLQPVVWKDDWPVMGQDNNSDGIGEPVSVWTKPNIGKSHSFRIPQTSDLFESPKLGLQWQWHANPQPGWHSLSEEPGALRLYCQAMPENVSNMWSAPNLILQKFPAPNFTVITQISFYGKTDGDRAGLMVMGLDYATLTVRWMNQAIVLEQVVCNDAENGSMETVTEQIKLDRHTVFLRLEVKEDALCWFSYGTGEDAYKKIGVVFKARPGKWIGTKVGLFALRPHISSEGGYADYAFFRIDES